MNLLSRVTTTGTSFVPLVEEASDVLTNLVVISQDSPEYSEKTKKILTLDDALQNYQKEQPDVIKAMYDTMGSTSSKGFHAVGVSHWDLVFHHGWSQIDTLALSSKVLSHAGSSVSSLANLVMKAYTKLHDSETVSFFKACKEGLDNDSVSALIADLDKLGPVTPLWRTPGVDRSD